MRACATNFGQVPPKKNSAANISEDGQAIRAVKVGNATPNARCQQWTAYSGTSSHSLAVAAGKCLQKLLQTDAFAVAAELIAKGKTEDDINAAFGLLEKSETDS